MRSITKPRPRGRPREFSCDEALEAATRVFWEKGFAQASLSDLTRAMGIERPSMYAAFGNKESLYRKTMERYREGLQEWVDVWRSAKTGRACVQKFLDSGVDRLTAPGGMNGCYAMSGLVNCWARAGKTRKAMETTGEFVESSLRTRLEEAISDGELPDGVEAGDLARFYVVVLHGMSLLAKAGTSRKALLRVAAVAIENFPRRRTRSA